MKHPSRAADVSFAIRMAAVMIGAVVALGVALANETGVSRVWGFAIAPPLGVASAALLWRRIRRIRARGS